MSKRRRPRATGEGDSATEFWGSDSGEVGEVGAIAPTSDPGALPRSLGAPPLSGRSAVALASLTTVYEEAVRTATALAAANGLLATGISDGGSGD